ncbi:MAG TPA: PilT/PilU family type 4a pilus ATPase [Blastocatellia bacterium]|jgi:twitching motility protein PilT|nr:PilT/PilU family type 4a pilus ATPase [Blastocatellia bacterium]
MKPEVLNQFLSVAVQKKASDVHLQAGEHPLFRINGQLAQVKYHPLTSEEMVSIIGTLAGEERFEKQFRDKDEFDVSYEIPNVCRFRANVFKQRGSYAAVLRVVPLEIKSFDELHLPRVMERIANLRRGLVLISGATGNGKSTTVSSIIEHINRSRKAHVVTIEDPIEFLFKNKMSVISQREVGTDTSDFKSALHAAMRQDPDVILLGEMRDHESVDIALKAAETGHLVISTIHTPDAQRTVGRLIGFFPAEEHPGARVRIAQNLMAVVSLRLLVSAVGGSRIPAAEVMLVTRSIEECIRNPEKTSEIHQYMQKGAEMGMQTFDQHLVELLKAGRVSFETAKLAATNPAELEVMLTYE